MKIIRKTIQKKIVQLKIYTVSYDLTGFILFLHFFD